jgi:outer membrane protease
MRRKSARTYRGLNVALRTYPATALVAITVVLGMTVIANAAQDDAARWPSIYEPQWPTVTGTADTKPQKPAAVTAAQKPAIIPAPPVLSAPETIVTGSAPSPVAKRWHDFKAAPVIVVPAFQGEFGLRWMNFGETAKNLYNIAGNAMVSRLTYDGLQGHAIEAYGRVDHTSGFYMKGYAGIGIVNRGNLNDEDFPPFVTPYSSTDSEQREGTLAYASIDLGYNLIRRPEFRLGAYAGYHYLDQSVSAYGCGQIAANNAICGNQIPDNVLVITQSNHWNSLRLGLDATIRLGGPFSLTLDAAWLPYVKLNGGDSHWLRIGTTPGSFAGEIPEDGQGNGYQLEAALAYAVNRDVSIAVGGRYWRMDTKGHTHFEGNVVGVNAFPQPVDWTVESYGVFVQGSFKFGPYPTSGIF